MTTFLDCFSLYRTGNTALMLPHRNSSVFLSKAEDKLKKLAGFVAIFGLDA
jgi:hypothetical protein